MVHVLSCENSEGKLFIKSMLNEKDHVLLIDTLVDKGYKNLRPANYTSYCIHKLGATARTLEANPNNLETFLKTV